jgi:acyl-homoserine-lactone acylase
MSPVHRPGLFVFLLACHASDPEKTPPGAEEDSGLPDTATPTDGVEIRRTQHGVVHVKADSYAGIGEGVGYAYTLDNRCLLAHRIAEVGGRLSAALGAEGAVSLPVHGATYTALESDRFYRGWLDNAVIAAGFAAGAPEVQELAVGFAAGINAAAAATAAEPACPVPFPATVTVDDVYRMWVATTLVASGEVVAPYLANAPPVAAAAVGGAPVRPISAGRLGSNAWALGREATQDGQAVHLYNPHFPWTGIHRVYVVHVTIPGELDVMGPALGGFPIPVAGYNADVAWGLTFSATARFTVAELPLVAGDPMRYTVDGVSHEIVAEPLEIEVLGEASPRTVSFYRAEAGPILHTPAFSMGWGLDTAYAVADVNADNTRMVEQFLALARASSVGEVQAALAAHQGAPWSYVTAADRAGDTLFAEISNVPAVSAALMDDCNHSATAEVLRPYGIVVLDGGRAECAWSGRLDPAALPWVIRADYVANSNNNHDLPNVNAPLLGYSPILSAEMDPLDLRPSAGLRMIEDRLAGVDGLGDPGFTAALAKTVFDRADNLAGALLVDEIVSDCLANPVGSSDGEEVDLTAVCTQLGDWDRQNTTDSVGAHIFAGLWMALVDEGVDDTLFATPADWADPIGTPAGLRPDAGLRATVRDALARVALTLEEDGVPLDAAWGEVNRILGPDGAVGVPGGAGRQGVFDVIESSNGYGSWRGWRRSLEGIPAEEAFGASYLHVVTLTAAGPVAEGLLTYAQATEVSSPFYLDELDAYGESAWFALPFAEEDILADPGLETVVRGRVAQPSR